MKNAEVKNKLGRIVSTFWLTVIIASAIVLSTAVFVMAAQNRIWMRDPIEWHGWRHDGMHHDEDDFANSTWEQHEDMENHACPTH